MAPKGGGRGGGGGSGGFGNIDFEPEHAVIIGDSILLIFALIFLCYYFKFVRFISPIIWATIFLMGTSAIDIPSVLYALNPWNMPNNWDIAIAFADTFYVFAVQLFLMAVYDGMSKGIKTRMIKMAWFGWWGISWLVGMVYIILHFVYSGLLVSIRDGGVPRSSTKYKIYVATMNALSRVWTTYSIFVLLSILLLTAIFIKSKGGLAPKVERLNLVVILGSLFLIWIINLVHNEVTKRLSTYDISKTEFRDWSIARALINDLFYIVVLGCFYSIYKFQHGVANGLVAHPVPQKETTVPVALDQNTTYYHPQTDQQQYTYPAPQHGQYAPVPQQSQPYVQQPYSQQQNQYGVPITQ